MGRYFTATYFIRAAFGIALTTAGAWAGGDLQPAVLLKADVDETRLTLVVRPISQEYAVFPPSCSEVRIDIFRRPWFLGLYWDDWDGAAMKAALVPLVDQRTEVQLWLIMQNGDLKVEEPCHYTMTMEPDAMDIVYGPIDGTPVVAIGYLEREPAP